MKKVILDTNFLLASFQFGIDIVSEIERVMHDSYHLCVLASSLQELKKINEQEKIKLKQAVKLALEIIEKNTIKVIKNSKTNNAHYVDDILVKLARENPKEIVIATQDKVLKQRLKEFGVKLIVMKGKRYLELV